MNENIENGNPNAIAVVGMSCRFPGAKNIDEFWQNLKNGIESISYFSEDEVIRSGISQETAKNPSLIKAFGVLEDADKFDAEFFGFSPREAELLDPQIRMFLESAWEAMENAAYDTSRIDGRVGVYASSSLSTYLLRNLLSNKELLQSTGGISAQIGNDKDHIPTRVSYVMNLKGPSIAIGTACSSSLVAVHLACQGLLDYHCDMAIAGGVTVHSNQVEGYFYNEGSIASPDGHCRTFDSKSGGAISGCGAGSVVLKRYADAVKDKDHIYAIILSSAVNNDGAVKVSYTAPGIEGQTEVIAEAHTLAEVTPDTITYVEAHGTATKLGDSIEIAALKKAFGASEHKKPFCAIGSVKSNIGHLDSAAGIAGFIKTVLSLKNKKIPPSIHFESQNPALNLDNSPFYVNNKLTEWATEGNPRRAGVSSFAMGGTNAHVILQEAEEDIPDKIESKICVIPISAKTENALADYSKIISEELSKESKTLNEIAYTLQIGRKPFRYRKAVVSGNTAELVKELNKAKSDNSYSGITDNSNTEIVFMFSGLGSHYVNMGLNLYNNNIVFRNIMNRCSEIYESITGENLLNIIYPGGTKEINTADENKGIDFFKMVRSEDNREENETELDKTKYAHPAIFSIEYSLAQMCFDYGIKPSALIGHSIGEYAALCVSGALSLEDSLKIIIERAHILEASPEGRMLTVDSTEEEIGQYLTESLSIAAVNDSSSCVIAGPENDIILLKNKLDKEGIIHRPVKTRRAFHSKLLKEKKDELRLLFENIHFDKTKYPIVSNLTGDWLSEDEIKNPEHWISHTTKTVRFYNGIRKMFDENYKNFLEIGPGQNLASFVLKSNPKTENRKINVNSIMKNIYDRQPDYEYLMKTIAKLWTAGININWESLYDENTPKRIPLPTYPFEHKRYWVEERNSEESFRPVNEESGISYITWKKSFSKLNPVDMIEEDYHWLLFKEPDCNYKGLTELMKQKGIKYVTIIMADTNEMRSHNEFVININTKKAFREIVDKIEKNGIRFNKIIYIPSLEKGLDHSGRNIILITNLLNELSTLTNDISISFLLDNAVSITGNETIDAASAVLYGFIKSINDEYWNIKTLCFETGMMSNSDEKDYYNNVLNYIVGQPDETVVSFRGKSKWIPDSSEIIPGTKDQSDDFHEKVLVLGSSDKLKNIIIGELNGKKNKQTIVISETPPFIQNSNDDFISIIIKKIDKKLSIKSIEEYEGLRNRLDKLCGMMAADYISHLIEWKPGKEYSLEITRSKVIEKHQKFFDYLLRISMEDGYIDIKNEKIKIRSSIDVIGSPEKEAEEIKKEYPSISGMIKILEYAASKYSDVFSGNMDNVNIFDNNESDIFDDIFNETPLRYEKQKVYINAVRELLNIIIAENPNRRINILEVGGGSGKLTVNLLADLVGKNVEYHFTDIGKSFTVDAEKLAEKLNIDFMKFSKYDISRDPEKQGIELSKYDIILAYDVIHATENLQETMKYLKTVTAPGGIMLIIEFVHPRRWANLMWGLQTGWWCFSDYRNNNLSPLVTLDEWKKLLDELDMGFSAAYPLEEPQRSNTAFGLIVTRKKEEMNRSILDIRNITKKLNENSENIVKGIDTFVLNSSATNEFEIEFQDIKNKYGQFDTIYLCENCVNNIPAALRDYEYHQDEAEYQIKRLKKIISSINEGRFLNGKLNILIEKSQNRFCADELIVSEYIIAFSNEINIDMVTAFIDDKYIKDSKTTRITESLRNISSTQVYFIHNQYSKSKFTSDAQTSIEHNSYSRPDLHNTYEEPKNDTEKKLAEIWKFMFGIEKIGISDNFFELGGDSLLAAKIITRIKNELEVVIKLPVFFNKPTVRDLADEIILNKNMIDLLTSGLSNDSGERVEGEI